MAKLKYPEAAYDAYALRHGSMTVKQQREEYSRLRSIAVKRLKRFKGTEWEDSLTYERNVNAYPYLREIAAADLPYKLHQLQRFITAEAGSVSGLKRIRDRSIQSLHEHGYTAVNRGNYKQFTEFMEEYRRYKELQEYDSGQVAELAEFFVKRRISVAEAFDAPPEVGSNVNDVFLWWLKNYDNIKKVDERAAKRHKRKPRSASEYAKAILKE